MKKRAARKSQKLSLHRETLRNLEANDLKDLHGGATLPCSALGSCVGCNTRNTCTTRFC